MDGTDRLRPYVAGLAVDWLQRHPDTRHRSVEGSLAFVDISGFTRLTERLAAKGKAGAEELSEILDSTFAQLLQVAYSYGALLVKWGGDAVLLLFEGPDHERLACRSAYEMRALMRRIGRLRTSTGPVTLRMSVGVHSGEFDFFMVGRRHHELVVAGPAATTTAELEALADAGEIAVSPRTAEALPARCLGGAKETGLLLRSAPPVEPRCRYWPNASAGFDFGSCLDPALRVHLAGSAVDSEHRHIAVGFVEVAGVDGLLAAQGPGAVAGELHTLMTSVQEACARHHVTFWETDISKDGFKILLLAGAPRATGTDEEGLLRAARAVLDEHTGALRVRIGANCGRAFVGDFGPDFRRSFSVKADAVNLAARVMAKAGPGQLLASVAILDRAKTRFETEPLEPFMVKGKSHPVHAAVVGRPCERVSSLAAAAFVGRASELRLLLARADAARAGHGGCIQVLGPAGVGKTRLVDEMSAAIVDSVDVVRTYGDAYQSSTPYFPLWRLLRGVIDLAADAPPHHVVTALERCLRSRAPELLPWMPLLAVPFGVVVADNAQTADVADEFRPHRITALTLALLRARVRRPTAFVVEEGHLVDDASVELLARLADEASTRSWLVVVVARTPVDALAGCGERIELPPLLADDSMRLVRSATANRPLPVRLERALVERAAGNPMFLLELTRAAETAPDGAELPETVEEVLAAQIDELAPAERAVLRTAAVLGVRFDDALLRSLLDPPPTTATWRALDDFLVCELGRHRFRSKILRDAAYEGLPYRRRRELHGRLADEIVRRAGTDIEDHAEALSLHYFEAQRYADAMHHAQLAGRRAERNYANPEALIFYRRARDAARHVAESNAVDIASLSESVGNVCAALTELEDAVEAYRDARRHAPGSAWLVRGRLALNIARATETAGAPRTAARWLATARRELRLADDRDAAAGLLGWVWVERALLAHVAGRSGTAKRWCAEAVRIAEPVGADEVVARALQLEDMIDLATGGRGDERRAIRALELFERCADLPRQTGMWNHLGAMSYFAGHWDLAVERYERSRELAQRCGDDWGAAIAASNIGEIRLDQGRLGEAEPLIREAAAVLRASGTPSHVGFVSALLGRLCARSGRFDEAAALFQQALDAYAAKDERSEIADTRLRLAEACVFRGDAAGGLRWEADARRLLSDADASDGPQTSALLRVRAQALTLLGRFDDAQTSLRRSLAAARERRSSHDVALALHALASARGGDSEAEVEASRLFADLGIRWVPSLPTAPGVAPTVDLSTVPRQRGAPSEKSIAAPTGS